MTGDVSECEYLYYIGSRYGTTSVYGTKFIITTPTNFSQIGTSTFGHGSGGFTSTGYKFEDNYPTTSRNSTLTFIDVFITDFSNNLSSYYYGDTATWNSSTNEYDLTIGGVTPTTLTPISNISGMVGYYTCKSGTDTSCATVYYVLAAYNNSSLTTIDLSNNENINTRSINFKVGTGYAYENGVYTLTGTSDRSINAVSFYNNPNGSSSYYGFYVCDNLTSTTCTNEVRYVMASNNRNFYYDSSNTNYTYANDVEYVNGEYKLVLNDPTNKPYRSFWDWSKKYNTANGINAAHYTCFDQYNEATNSCGSSVYYISSAAYSIIKVWELFGGDKAEDVLQGMYNINNTTSSQINKYNSPIKGEIDRWYVANLSSLSSYLDDNAVFCNDRTFSDAGILDPNGGTAAPKFKNYTIPAQSSAKLGCTNISDRFSKNNTNEAALDYSIGLLTTPENVLMQDYYSTTGQAYWLMSPRSLTTMNSVTTAGVSSNTSATSASGIRPVIVLKPGITITGGNGTYNTPYIVDINS